MTLSKVLLSGSTNGQPVLVAATSDPGTTIHTAQSGTTGVDEIWLYAHNTTSSAVTLTLEFGGNGTTNLIAQSIPPQSGLFQVLPGLLLQNSLVVKAYASTTNVVAVSGFVNRIS